jgi:predicted DNA-binding ribbon-helix-helix protein
MLPEPERGWKYGMKTAVFRHSIFINGRKTSLSLEDEFWYGLLEIAVYKKMSVPKLVEQIDDERKTDNLSSAIRIFVFNYFRARIGKQKLRAARRKKR